MLHDTIAMPKTEDKTIKSKGELPFIYAEFDLIV